MTKNNFVSYIKNTKFKELFNELGWDNADSSYNIAIPDGNKGTSSFDLDTVAQKRGYTIWKCFVDTIPLNRTYRAIDSKLRKTSNDYILIFVTKDNPEHQMWLVPVKTVEKRNLITIEFETDDQINFLYSKINGLTFDINETVTIVDVTRRVKEIFSINGEKITKDFYAGFKKQHDSFAKFIHGIGNEKITQHYVSVMLNRLMFCYFIQKKKFLDNDVNYLEHKLEWSKKQEGQDKFFKSFYKNFLTYLFAGGLNTPEHDEKFKKICGRIPYLNGGMFDQHQIEKDYKDINIDDKAFEELFAFFDKWEWHLDTRITASGRDINPDVLGYIFEQYINDRAQMGAYYTKEDITEYIDRNTIVPYLMEATRKAYSAPFEKDGEVWASLKDSGDKYIYDAVKKGCDLELPSDIANGLDTTKPNLIERRKNWNTKTSEDYALPTEIWRETVARRQRYTEVKAKISRGEVTDINDFITYNLDLRSFVQDLLLNTKDEKLVKTFYEALKSITILDPTCGSGAFLFAAMNILEPLYQTCIDRMQEFNEQDSSNFNTELSEIADKYRSNIQYFIYKNIILHNLYGVDIMAEATEIAKLRLFLKMVAVVDVDFKAPNLGLDPLPDIDFNIKTGNTLVGYANKKELLNDLNGDMIVKLEFESDINKRLMEVNKAFNKFKEVQFNQVKNLTSFKSAKQELCEKLSALNLILNQRMHSNLSKIDINQWLNIYQPFHWLAEFYEIIVEKGGFDIIIGNPPYVTLKEGTLPYKIPEQFISKDCGDLFGICLERFYSLSKTKVGVIIPLSLMSTKKMEDLKKYLLINSKSIWTSFYSASAQPSCLFEGVRHRLLIYISEKGTEIKNYYSTDFLKWFTEERKNLFMTRLIYEPINEKCNGTCKISTNYENDMLSKILKEKSLECYLTDMGTPIYYHNAPVSWGKAFNFIPLFQKANSKPIQSSHIKTLYANSEAYADLFICILNSTLFYWYNWQYTNCRDLTLGDIFKFQCSFEKFNDVEVKKISELCISLMKDYKKNSTVYTRISSGIVTKFDSFYPALSKSIIDKIDTILAKHYGFTEEELDFIINYDIKYRMGTSAEDEE